MNRRYYKYLFIILVFSTGASFLCAQNTIEQDSTYTVARDSSQIEVTYFKENITDRYSGNDFNYNINDTGGVNLVQQVLRKFFGWLNDLFGINVDVNYKTLEYIVYGLLGVIVLYLLIKFLLQNPVNSVFKTESKSIDGFSYIEENIAEVDFDSLIATSLKENNFRLATRYLYLKSLKVLTQKNTIDWHYDKTNTDYLNEIKDEKLKALFKRVSYIYDYVWYGEFPIDESGYNKNKTAFNQLITAQSNG